MSETIGLVLMVGAGIYIVITIVITIGKALDKHEARIEALEKNSHYHSENDNP